MDASSGGNAIVSLGANLGDSLRTICTAAAMLRDAFGSSAVRFSSLLITPPIGGPGGQSPFYNAVCCIERSADAFELWHKLREIESALGRQREHRWESRRIDLDILLYGRQRWWTPHLKIPHPRMVTRSFALLPAAEIAPTAIEPVSGLDLTTLANRLGYPRDWTACRGKIRQLPGHHGRVLVCCIASLDTAALVAAYRGETQSASETATAANPQGPVEAEPIFVRLPADHHPTADAIEIIDRHRADIDCRLLVLATRGPDPLSAAWEDYAAEWAGVLGMQDAANDRVLDRTPQWPLAKYLLDCHDERWAGHELHAAMTAMNCEFEVACRGGHWAESP